MAGDEKHALRGSDMSWREVEGVVAVLDLRSSNFFELNRQGSLLWRALAEGQQTADDLAEELVACYDVEHAQALEDVGAFLRSLRQAGLLDGDR